MRRRHRKQSRWKPFTTRLSRWLCKIRIWLKSIIRQTRIWGGLNQLQSDTASIPWFRGLSLTATRSRESRSSSHLRSLLRYILNLRRGSMLSNHQKLIRSQMRILKSSNLRNPSTERFKSLLWRSHYHQKERSLSCQILASVKIWKHRWLSMELLSKVRICRRRTKTIKMGSQGTCRRYLKSKSRCADITRTPRCRNWNHLN